MQRGKNKTCEAELGGEEDKKILVNRRKENTDWRQRGWGAKLRDETVTGWAEWHEDQGKQFNMNMDKALSCICGRIIRSKDCETGWCQWPILIWYQRCWEELQLRDRRSDTGNAEGVWQRLKAHSWHSCKSNITGVRTLRPLVRCSPPAPLCTACYNQTDTNPPFLSGRVFKLKRQVSSTMATFTCMREIVIKKYHQNLCSGYCCLISMQINFNTVIYLDNDRKSISNDYRAAGVIVSSCLASPIKNKARGDQQNIGLGFDSAQVLALINFHCAEILCWNEASKTFSFSTSILIRWARKYTHKTWSPLLKQEYPDCCGKECCLNGCKLSSLSARHVPASEIWIIFCFSRSPSGLKQITENPSSLYKEAWKLSL